MGLETDHAHETLVLLEYTVVFDGTVFFVSNHFLLVVLLASSSNLGWCFMWCFMSTT